MARERQQQQDPLDKYMRMYGQLGPEGQTRETLAGDELQQRQALEQYARQHGFPSLAAMKLAQDEENQQGNRDLRKQALSESSENSARELANIMSQTGDNVGAKAILNELAKKKGFNVGQQTGNPLDEKLRKVAQATGAKVLPLLARPQEQTGTAEPLVAEGATGGVSSGGSTNYEFHPGALVQNPAAEGLGKVLGAEGQVTQGQAGTRHLDMSGNEINPLANHDPFTNGTFKSAPERLAEMTNKTGAYAPKGYHGQVADVVSNQKTAREQFPNEQPLVASQPKVAPTVTSSQLVNPPTNENMAARPELRPASTGEPMATSALTAPPTSTPTAGGDILDNAHIMAGLKALGQYFNVPKLPEEQKRLKLATAP